LLRHAKRDRQGESALAAPDIATEDDEIPAAETTAKELVEAGKPGRDRIGGRSAIGYGIDAAQQE
jgi:hypothetical protein